MAQDFLFGTDGDIAISNGDFVVGESTNQHKQDLLVAAPGHYRHAPLIGADIAQYINDAIDTGEIKTAMMADGLKGVKVKVNNNTITVDGEYE
ncbi:MAG: hypothetical protein HC896_00010 [Bacteroidales bacterium]|nr:hypothetical protein [Bacteroidales bacterium]